ncbi:helix-turn-helix transcriptional regulator [Gordonia sp. TBRC 11910]|uniref:Helix-turn-helix transcriptional regulator n=1 Tax=Gordonia asplenii TaxID=2725283 RepID=A0A848KYG2_9ACTN|nr:TetR/AcrR family transcriptional regulator [Gordonia asplenii]NMO01251.1 helix-turn-helix transcriptional regulator [Gordonia asplenii]
MAQIGRTYDGSRRRAAADARRHRIVEEATKLFVAQGFGSTSIDQIARAADVSTPTVYAAFGSKANVLGTAIDFALAGDVDGVPVADRYLAALDAVDDDVYARFAAAAEFLRALNESVAPLIRVMELAASADPALRDLRAALMAALRADSRLFIERFFADHLRPGLSVDDAADSLAVITSPSLFSMFTVDAGWAPEKYERWIAESLPRLLVN